MPLAENTKSRLLDDACAMIEDMGGVGGLIDDEWTSSTSSVPND